MKRQIFISYDRADEAFAAALATDLATSGARVWLDIHHAEPGRYWARSIEQALAESHMMIVILSPAALASAPVMAEWQAYLEAHRPVVPVLAAPCDAPGPLRTRSPIDFTRARDYSKAFHRLTARLIDCDSRTHRSDPVIWSLARPSHTSSGLVDGAEPPSPDHPDSASPAPDRARSVRERLANLALRWES